MTSLAELWSLLRQVRSLRFDARSQSATGWDGVGTGTVAVSEPAPGVVVFEEAGTWQPSLQRGFGDGPGEQQRRLQGAGL